MLARLHPLARTFAAALGLAAGFIVGATNPSSTPACGLVACALAESANVAVDDITLDAGFGTYIIKHLDATGSSLSAAELKALFSGKGNGLLGAQLAKWSAKDVTIPEVAFQQTIAGVNQKLIYSNLKLTDVVNGKIGTFSAASGHMTSEIVPGQAMDVALGSMTGTNIDTGALVAMMTEKAADVNAPLRPLYESFAINGYSIKIPNGEFSIGSVAARDIKGRPMTMPLSEMIKNLPKPKEPGQEPSPEEMKKMMTFVGSIFDIYGAFSFGSLEMRDFKAAFKGDPNQAQPPVDMSISRMGATGFENFKLAESTIEGFKMTLPTGTFRVGKYSIKDVAFKDYLDGLKLLLAKIAEAPGAKPPSDIFTVLRAPTFKSFRIAGVDADFIEPPSLDNAGQAPQLGRFALRQFSMTDFADAKLGELALEGAEIGAPMGKLHLGKLAIRGLDYKDALASFMDLMAKGTQAAEQGAEPSMAGDLQIKLPRLGEFLVSDLSGDVPATPSPETTEAKPGRIVFSLAGLNLKPVLADDGTPKSISFSLDHFVTSIPQGLPGTAELGVDAVDLSSKIDASYDKAAQVLSIDKLSMDSAGLGGAALTAKLGSVPPEAFSTNKLMAEAAWLGAVIKSIDIRANNTGLLQKILTMQAKQSGKPEGEIREGLIAAAAVGIPQLLGNSPAAKTVANAIAKFLADPKTLHIEASSKDGIGASDAVEPDKILDKMELKASAND